MQNKHTWYIVTVAIVAAAVFTVLPWVRSEAALSRAAALEIRLEQVEGSQAWRFPQLIRYTARGTMIDIDLETTRLPGEDAWAWVERCNHAWEALKLPDPDDVSVQTDQHEEVQDGEAR